MNATDQQRLVKEALRGFYIYHVLKKRNKLPQIALEQLFMVLSITFFFIFVIVYFRLSLYFSLSFRKHLSSSPSRFIKHFLIHILHIYLRVNIRKAKQIRNSLWTLFNISCCTEMSASPFSTLGVPGCLLLVSVPPHWKHRNASSEGA